MQQLANLAGTDALRKVSIAITHIKPNGNNEAMIKKQLQQGNALQLKLVFPAQGNLLEF